MPPFSPFLNRVIHAVIQFLSYRVLDSWASETLSFLFIRLFPMEPPQRIPAALCLSSGCYNKIHKLGGLSTTEMYFSQLQRLCVQGQGASMVRFWWESSPSHRWLTSRDMFTWQKESELTLWPLLIKAPIPFTMATPSWLHYLTIARTSKSHDIQDFNTGMWGAHKHLIPTCLNLIR